jgi:hypothetical protein
MALALPLLSLWWTLQPAPAPAPEASSPAPAEPASEPVPEASSPAPAEPASEPAPEASSPAPAEPPAPAPVPEASPPPPASEPAPTKLDLKYLRRTRFQTAAIYDIVGGGSRPMTWATALQGGFPWSSIRGQVGLGPRGLAIGLDLETARFRRFRPALLIALRWVDRPRVRVTGELLLGWLVQIGELARRGPNAELRLRVAFPVGRVAPYLLLATSHTLLTDRVTINTSDGETRDLSFRHEWLPRASLGLAVAISRAIGLEAGVDLAWYDAPSATPSIPGFHLGLAFGGGAR